MTTEDWNKYFSIHCHLPAAAIRDLFDGIDERDQRIGKLLTVLYSADAFMRCPAENHEELSKLVETLREAIAIASDPQPDKDKD